MNLIRSEYWTTLPQIALALRARAILLVFEKFTRAYLFQIALEIMWLPIQKLLEQFQFLSDPCHFCSVV